MTGYINLEYFSDLHMIFYLNIIRNLNIALEMQCKYYLMRSLSFAGICLKNLRDLTFTFA